MKKKNGCKRKKKLSLVPPMKEEQGLGGGGGGTSPCSGSVAVIPSTPVDIFPRKTFRPKEPLQTNNLVISRKLVGMLQDDTDC
jgi:hypothetical protein